MITRHKLSRILDATLHPEEFADFCPNGLQVEGKKELGKIATAVTANLATIERAIAEEVDALIVHHGLFWNRDPYPIVGLKRRRLSLLLAHEISLFSYHLPLDAHPKLGNNWKAAKDLGWEGVEAFGDGVRGSFASRTIDTFVAELEAYYSHDAVTALGGQKEVKSAALISGGAYKELERAAEIGVDCFITGNFDEPAWAVAHEAGIHFCALGHSATERVGVKALGEFLQRETKIPTAFLDIENPF